MTETETERLYRLTKEGGERHWANPKTRAFLIEKLRQLNERTQYQPVTSKETDMAGKDQDKATEHVETVEKTVKRDTEVPQDVQPPEGHDRSNGEPPEGKND